MADLPEENSEQDVIEDVDFLKKRMEFYSEEESRLRGLFEQLEISEDDIKLIIRNATEATGLNPIELMLNYEIDSLNPTTVAMARATRLEKEKNDKQTEKLLTLNSYYKTLNENLDRDISYANQCLNDPSIDLSTENLSQLEKKLEVYKNEFDKFSKKFPWLKVSALHLPNIVEETKEIEKLRAKKEKLLEEINVYGGLKPDMEEAAKQLEDIKKEHAELCTKILSSK